MQIKRINPKIDTSSNREYSKKYSEAAQVGDFDIFFNQKESFDQEGLFTPEHVKYDCLLHIVKKVGRIDKGRNLCFPYQCNPRFTKPSLADCMNAVLSDASAHRSSADLADFLEEYGYCEGAESVRKGIEAYEQCKAYDAFFADVFTDAEFDKMLDTFGDPEFEIEEDEPEI